MLELLGPALAWGSADRHGTVNRAPLCNGSVWGQWMPPLLPSEWLAVLVRQTGLGGADYV